MLVLGFLLAFWMYIRRPELPHQLAQNQVTSTTRAAMPFGPIPSMIRPSPTFHRNSPKPLAAS
jgi:hypothetical protein